MPECLQAIDWYASAFVTIKEGKWKHYFLRRFDAQLIEVCNEKPLLFLTANQKTAPGTGRFAGESSHTYLSAGC